MTDPIQYIATLVDLHLPLERQGPGDRELALDILHHLPPLPAQPRIADLGCGTGAGARLLAEYFGSPVLAVDFAPDFIEQLAVRARKAGLADLIRPIVGDMASLDWPSASLDLIWSEGAVYNLGFERALRLWRPLLRDGGLAVISEMSWFAPEVPEPAATFWKAAYPAIADEAENSARATSAGFQVLAARRLPSAAWWTSYYEPLRARIDAMEKGDDPMLSTVIAEIRAEMDLFERFSDFYGYVFYVLQASERPDTSGEA